MGEGASVGVDRGAYGRCADTHIAQVDSALPLASTAARCLQGWQNGPKRGPGPWVGVESVSGITGAGAQLRLACPGSSQVRGVSVGVRVETERGPQGEAERGGPAWQPRVWGPEGWCGGRRRSECQCVSLQGLGRWQTPGI